jgi:hypothetical protein
MSFRALGEVIQATMDGLDCHSERPTLPLPGKAK